MKSYFSIFMFGVLSGLVFSPGCAVSVNYPSEKSNAAVPHEVPRRLQHPDFDVASNGVDGEQLHVSIRAIENALGDFEQLVPVRVVDEVRREGQALGHSSFWSGAIKTEPNGKVIEIARRVLATNDDLRFYLAHARLQQREEDLGCEAVRVGLAHFLRTDNGFDPTSWKLYCNVDALNLRHDLDTQRLKTDWRYRDAARGTCWACVYYLARHEGKSPEEILRLGVRDLPDPEELRMDLVRDFERGKQSSSAQGVSAERQFRADVAPKISEPPWADVGGRCAVILVVALAVVFGSLMTL